MSSRRVLSSDTSSSLCSAKDQTPHHEYPARGDASLCLPRARRCALEKTPGKLREEAQRSVLSLSLSSMVDGKEELPQEQLFKNSSTKSRLFAWGRCGMEKLVMMCLIHTHAAFPSHRSPDGPFQATRSPVKGRTPSCPMAVLVHPLKGALHYIPWQYRRSSARSALRRQRKRQCPKAMGRLHQANAPPLQEKYLPGLALSSVAVRQPHAHTSVSDLAPLHPVSHPVDQRSS